MNENGSRVQFGNNSFRTKRDLAVFASAASSILCLILCAFCLLSLNGVKKDINSITMSVNESIALSNQNYNELYERISNLENTVNSTQQAVNGSTATKYIQITKQPDTVQTTVGRDGAMIFSVNATGNSLTMAWQKYDEVSGEWMNIVFDLDGFNDDLGIRLYDNSTKGVSELWTRNLTEKAFGRYRCHITDAGGVSVDSNAVFIEEKGT